MALANFKSSSCGSRRDSVLVQYQSVRHYKYLSGISALKSAVQAIRQMLFLLIFLS